MNTKWGGFLAIAVLAFATLGCGQSEGPETVYVNVFNGYPGSQSLSLYGPSGAVTTNLPFGERTQNFVPVDRNLGTDFELVLDGAPQTFNVDIPLYNLYPQETVTVFFKRRTGEETVDDPQMFRHVQTGYSDDDNRCRLILDNGLSLKNDSIGQFNYVPLFKVQPACTGYVDQIGTYDDTGTTVETEAEEEIQVGRPGLFEKIQDNPWFIATDVGSGEVLDVRDAQACSAHNASGDTSRIEISAGDDTFAFTWAPGSEINYQSGSFRAQAPTRQYMNCIGWDPDKPKDKQKIRSEQVLECKRSPATTKPVQLGDELVSYRFRTGLGLDANGDSIDQCGFEVSMDSDFFNIFEDPAQGPSPEVRSTLTYPPNQYYFWILYGRPVNPKFEHWGANTPGRGGGFVELPRYPGAE